MSSKPSSKRRFEAVRNAPRLDGAAIRGHRRDRPAPFLGRPMDILIVLLMFSIACVVLSLIAGLIPFARVGARRPAAITLFLGLWVIVQIILVVVVSLLPYLYR
jgi:hypothetical protein